MYCAIKNITFYFLFIYLCRKWSRFQNTIKYIVMCFLYETSHTPPLSQYLDKGILHNAMQILSKRRIHTSIFVSLTVFVDYSTDSCKST